MSDVTSVVPIGTIPAELQQIVSASHLTHEGQQAMLAAFAPHFVAYLNLEGEASSCPQDDPKEARRLRLAIRAVRITTDKVRKDLKEDSLRSGQAIDGIARLLRERSEGMEDRLDKIERAREIAEANRIAELSAARCEVIEPYVNFVSATEIEALGKMPEIEFQRIFDRAKASHESERERIASEEAARLEQERQDREERERIQQENERLRAERAEIERQANEERRERERLQAEARAREEAERQAEAARVTEARRLAAAPDKEKLLAFAATVRALPSPECDTEAGCAVVAELDTMIERFAQVIERKAAELERGF